MALRLLFQILGWETSVEKGGGFAELARVLDVEIDLARARLGLIMAKNSPSRIADIIEQIDAILISGRHSRATSRSFVAACGAAILRGEPQHGW